MKTASIYSLLSLRLVPGTGEKLLLGLLMSDEGRVCFDFSRKRLDLATKLLNSGDYQLVKALLNSLKNELNGNEVSGLFIPQSQDWSEAYLNYLSRYSTNLVSFDAPKKLELPFTQETYDTMFSRFFGSLPEANSPVKQSFEKRVKT